MILLAPTAFKGTIGAVRAAAAMAEGARRVSDDVVTLPLSDGGHGLIEALAAARRGSIGMVRVSGPLGEPTDARVLTLNGDALIESADANGLHLVAPDRRDPMVTTSRGVGELIRAAAAGGPQRLVVGIGGSATVDGGVGMARALGWRLLDEGGSAVLDGGQGLLSLDRIEPPDRPPALPPITVLRDVGNPLLGPDGAAPVFGPQKGATREDVDHLARGLERLADTLARDLGRDVRDLPGAGAAGGLGAALAAFLDGELVDGASWVLDAVGFDAALARADVVVTGEGAYDAQSAMGKVVGEVIRRARQRDVPVLLVAGSVEGDVPPGVHAVAGGSRALEPADLERMVATELDGLTTG